MKATIRARVQVQGIVQGVGFRPFVYALATRLGLSGHVRNDSSGVLIEIEGPRPRIDDFMASLRTGPPALARVERVSITPLAPGGAAGFSIDASEPAGQRTALVTADTATCADCLRELYDRNDRRFGYAFINCTNCGPRFTIVRDVPYDRALTTMAEFAMCGRCAAEYGNPADRRFHAQPVCCPDCGPKLRLLDCNGRELPADPIAGGGARLAAGAVLAVKGLGGYHLAVDAGSEPAAAALRARKRREDKPFALMVATLADAARICVVDEAAGALLASGRRPIVLLPRRASAGDGAAPGTAAAAIAPSVAPHSRYLGVMLPYTPLHHLLLRQLARPIVLTSGNRSDEPIAYEDQEALTRLGGIADAFLTHDRAIHVRTDDSVVRSFRGREMIVRRSRGYAPEPLRMRLPFPRPVLACGAELKNTFCLGKGDHAFISPHIGDLEDHPAYRCFTDGIAHFQRLFGVRPDVVAHDLHPEYLSTKYAEDQAAVAHAAVQHHHAHIASCLADAGEEGPVIGVAFDGLGYGSDGTMWGGEFLIADLCDFERAGHLAPVPMPGGAAAIRQPWRMAAAYLDAAFGGAPPDSLDVGRRNARRWRDVRAMARRGINAPLTSSAGRLFDAVAAIVGVRDVVNYEGQAAAELEQLADPAERGGYPAGIYPGPPLVISGADLVGAVVADLAAGIRIPAIAARFHNGLAAVITASCAALRERSGLAAVALSGGVFQNMLLLDRTVTNLHAAGFRVLVHSRVPPNDGGISLGQAAVAAARDRLGLLHSPT